MDVRGFRWTSLELSLEFERMPIGLSKCDIRTRLFMAELSSGQKEARVGSHSKFELQTL